MQRRKKAQSTPNPHPESLMPSAFMPPPGAATQHAPSASSTGSQGLTRTTFTLPPGIDPRSQTWVQHQPPAQHQPPVNSQLPMIPHNEPVHTAVHQTQSQNSQHQIQDNQQLYTAHQHARQLGHSQQYQAGGYQQNPIQESLGFGTSSHDERMSATFRPDCGPNNQGYLDVLQFERSNSGQMPDTSRPDRGPNNQGYLDDLQGQQSHHSANSRREENEASSGEEEGNYPGEFGHVICKDIAHCCLHLQTFTMMAIPTATGLTILTSCLLTKTKGTHNSLSNKVCPLSSLAPYLCPLTGPRPVMDPQYQGMAP